MKLTKYLFPLILLSTLSIVSPPSLSQSSQRTIEITIQNFSFAPSSVDLAPGETVTFRVINKDSASHTFTVDGSFDLVLEGGQTSTVNYTAPAQSGSILFKCRFHPSMTGEINVVSSSSTTESSSSSLPFTIIDTTSTLENSSSTSENSLLNAGTSSKSDFPWVAIFVIFPLVVFIRRNKV